MLHKGEAKSAFGGHRFVLMFDGVVALREIDGTSVAFILTSAVVGILAFDVGHWEYFWGSVR